MTLRQPTPLGTPLSLQTADGTATVFNGENALAICAPGATHVTPPPAPSWAAALAAAPTYVGLTRHPFPSCLVCGPARDDHDALALRPGRLGPDLVASPWIPAAWTADDQGGVALPAVWAALDCPSAWAIDDEGRSVVLGRITARIDSTPRVGERYVVAGWVRERASRRRALCGSALYDTQGTVLAVAESSWFAVDAATFGR